MEKGERIYFKKPGQKNLTQDIDEKDGVSADGWKKNSRAVTSFLDIFVRGVVKITTAPSLIS